ncbi:ATP synthase F0 subunit 6 (mitochondrion) [Lepeophtheirus salmonis]|uniref:ATP synthase subunit a n=1 Tax=Lepeophtheirus salmonis TaxID=72036 RepID=A9QXJ4_LEPSM|nr:ATP synthase F0 subunit 6 [Lepeophtheirus salmonis]ABX59300.1 ATP synthase F0 subunit 6 [Lepeophtheirus salmonis]
MNSLFSSFDANGLTNWYLPSLASGLLMFPGYWLVGNTLGSVWSGIFSAIHSDVKILFSEGGGFMLMSLFLSILSMNFLGLFPYIFTSSSHICVSLGMGLPLWLGSQMVCWVYSSEQSFAHLVPEGAPSGLIPLLVLIESISSLIRPLTLSVRLMANMIAGHLLLILLGSNASVGFPLSILLTMLGLLFLVLLELGVSLIQSYVFMLLSSLYVSETLH